MPDPLLGWVYASGPLRAMRILVGSAALVRLATLIPQLRAAADPATAEPLVWGGLVTAWTWPLLAAMWALGAMALVVGRRTSLGAGLLALTVLVLLGADANLRWSHLYVLGLAATIIAAGGRSFDGARRGPGGAPQVPGWPVLVVRIQVSIIYGFAGLAKVNEDFVSGLVLFENLAGSVTAGWLPPQVAASPVALTTLAVAVICAELWLAAGLWVTRWFFANLAVAVVLHAGMLLLARDGQEALHFALFAVLMWALVLAFRYPLRRCPASGHGLVGSAGFEPAASRV